MALSGLDELGVGRFLAEVTGSEPSPQVAAAVHGRSDGNPFFVGELGRLLATHDGAALGSPTDKTEVPAGVRDVIGRRLARLPDGTRQLLAAAAVMGREFDLEVLFSLSPADRDTTLDLLEPALQAGLVIESREARTCYRFCHALVAETIYDQSTPIGRARLHRLVGEALEHVHPDDDRVHVVELADHFFRAVPAVPIDKAFGYAVRAAEVAQGRLAYEQAEEQLRRAVELAPRLAADQRASRELDVQIRLFLLLMRRGYAAPGVGEASARALELSRAVQDTEQVEVSLMGVAVFAAVSSDYDTAQACGVELVTLGKRSDEAMLALSGTTLLGMVAFLRGDLNAAHAHNERAMAIGDATDRASLVTFSGNEPHSDPRLQLAPDRMTRRKSHCRPYAAVVEWLRGEPDAARRLIAEGIRLAGQPGGEFTLANTLIFDAMLGVFAGDADWALTSATEAVELSDTFGFRLYHAFAAIVRGWAIARLGDTAAGEADVEKWLAVTQEHRASCLRPFHLGLLADTRRQAGRIESALETVEEAIGYSSTGGDRFWDAELHRLRGELLAAVEGRVGEAEHSLHEAISTARRQGAWALEARARQSLVRLAQAAPVPGPR